MGANELMRSIITVDGPSGSGKGTLCLRLSKELGFACLDSGALYRLLGLKVSQSSEWIHQKSKPTADQIFDAEQMARQMDVRFEVQDDKSAVILDGVDVTRTIRTEEVGSFASQVACLGPVRSALLDFQREFYTEPGLIADGRDMGTVVFPDAPVKFYLSADPKIRAQRRHDELLAAGKQVNMSAIFQDIVSRDERDMDRDHAPLKPASDAVIIDSTSMSAQAVFEQALAVCQQVLN